MASTLRAFIALDLPPGVRQALADQQAALRSQRLPLRWVRPDNMHLTLAFLGEIAADRVPQVGDLMAAAAATAAPLTLTARGLGVFPGLRRPRVLWVGLAGHTHRLQDLQRQLADRLTERGYLKRRESFRGHLTLGRFKGRADAGRLGRLLQAHAGFASEAFEAGDMRLYRSRLQPSGAVYTELLRVALSGPAGGTASAPTGSG
jgi:2'-5' RNA ligase